MTDRAARFFHPSRVGAALDAYALRRKGRGWWVSEKARLYGLADAAFANGRHDAAPFAEIHRTLRAYWQIFRNGPGWSAERVYAVLTSPACRQCARGRLDLVSFARARPIGALWTCLAAMSGVKTLPAGNVSAMAVSKFLHFFNPTLFPIYDRAVVRNRAFPWFREEIDAAHERWRDRLAPFEEDTLYARGLGEYVRYFVWAADQVAAVNAQRTMRVFARRFARMVRDEARGGTLPKDLENCYATAFEFAMIGALDLTPSFAPPR